MRRPDGDAAHRAPVAPPAPISVDREKPRHPSAQMALHSSP